MLLDTTEVNSLCAKISSTVKRFSSKLTIVVHDTCKLYSANCKPMSAKSELKLRREILALGSAF